MNIKECVVCNNSFHSQKGRRTCSVDCRNLLIKQSQADRFNGYEKPPEWLGADPRQRIHDLLKVGCGVYRVREVLVREGFGSYSVESLKELIEKYSLHDSALEVRKKCEAGGFRHTKKMNFMDYAFRT